MPSAQLSIDYDVGNKIASFLASCSRFTSFVSTSINARNQLSFFALNGSNSCYAVLNLKSSKITCNNTSRLNPEDEVFKQSFRVPLRPLLHFLSRICAQETEITIDFSRFGISAFGEPFVGGAATYKTQVESSPQMGINIPPLERFSNQIMGCDHEWFLTLLLSVNKSTVRSSAVLALQCIPGTGLKIALPGPEEAQVTVATFQFTNYTASQFAPILVCLSEFLSFLNLCKKYQRPVDLFFGASGQPLVATFSSVDGVDCQFVMSTMTAQPSAISHIEEEDEIPATDDEDENKQDSF